MMEHQILICNEPSPQSPSPTGPPSASSTSTTTSTIRCLNKSNLMTFNHHNYHHHFNYFHHQKSIVDQSSLSPTTSDSSGYDSTTSSIISSNHSNYDDYGDDTGHSMSTNRTFRKRNYELKNYSNNRNNRNSNHHNSWINNDNDDHNQQKLINDTEIVISNHDYNLLNDQERILKQMLMIEQRYVPADVIENVYYSNKINDINERTRFELTEWMHEVCELSKCEAGIFTLAVNYLDRFISAKPTVPKQNLQLAGIVCMLIASKIRQCHTFDLEFLSYTSDFAFSVKEILIWEQLILRELSWDVSSIIANDYLDYLLVILTNLLTTKSTPTTKTTSKTVKNAKNLIEKRNNHSRNHRRSSNITKDNCSNNNNNTFNMKLRNRKMKFNDNTINTTIDTINNNSTRKRKTSINNNKSNCCPTTNQTSKRMKIAASHNNVMNMNNMNMNNDDSIVYEKHNSLIINNNDHQSCSSRSLSSSSLVTNNNENNSNDSTTTNAATSTTTIETIIRRHANTLIELCSIDLTFVSVKPSIIASACVANAIQGFRSNNEDNNDNKLPENGIISTIINDNNDNTTNDNNSPIKIPNNLYERFLLAIEKQIGIDSDCIRKYGKHIDNLIRNESSSSSSIMDSNKLSTSMNDRNSIIDTNVNNATKEMIESSSSLPPTPPSSKINDNDSIIEIIPSLTTATATATTIVNNSTNTTTSATILNSNANELINDQSMMVIDDHRCYHRDNCRKIDDQQQHLHSIINYTTSNIDNIVNKTSTTTVMDSINSNYHLSNSKQLFFNRHQHQPQETCRYNNIPNHFQRSCSSTLLHDTINDGRQLSLSLIQSSTTPATAATTNAPAATTATPTTTWLNDLNLKTTNHSSTTFIDLLNFLENNNNRQNISICIDFDQSTIMNFETSNHLDMDDQENRPPPPPPPSTPSSTIDHHRLDIDLNSTNDNINDDHVTTDDDHDDGFGDDLYF